MSNNLKVTIIVTISIMQWETFILPGTIWVLNLLCTNRLNPYIEALMVSNIIILYFWLLTKRVQLEKLFWKFFNFAVSYMILIWKLICAIVYQDSAVYWFKILLMISYHNLHRMWTYRSLVKISHSLILCLLNEEKGWCNSQHILWAGNHSVR